MFDELDVEVKVVVYGGRYSTLVREMCKDEGVLGVVEELAEAVGFGGCPAVDANSVYALVVVQSGEVIKIAPSDVKGRVA